MKLITQQMIEASYDYGKKYARGEISLSNAIDLVISESGMKRGSASNALKNMKCLINEKIYFNMMSAHETIWRLEQIKREFGIEKYLRTLSIVEKHIATKSSPQTKIREYIQKNKDI